MCGFRARLSLKGLVYNSTLEKACEMFVESDPRVASRYLFFNTAFNLTRALYSSTYALYLSKTLRLPLGSIPTLLALHLVVITSLEVPTGAFADTMGRKLSFILSLILSALGYAIYAAAKIPTIEGSRFALACVAECILAVGYTFYSGSLDAWGIDLAGVVSADDLRSLLVKAQLYKNIFFTMGGVLGAVAFFDTMGNRTPSPFFIAAAVCLLLLPLAIRTMPERIASKSDQGRRRSRALFGHTYAAAKAAFAEPRLSTLILLSGVAYALLQLLVFFWPVFIVETARRTDRIETQGAVSISLAWILAYGLRTIGNAAAGVYKNLKQTGLILTMSSVTFGAPTIFLYLLAPARVLGPQKTTCLAIAAYGVIRFADGLSDPLRQAATNYLIRPQYRATVLSLSSMVSMLFAAIALAASGNAVRQGVTITSIWLAGGLLVLFTCPLYAFTDKGKEH